MSESPRLSFGDLFKAMKGKDSLRGWDVLVSLQEDQLNVLLAERVDSLKIHDVPSIRPSQPLPLRGEYKVDIQLLKPRMEFTETGSNVKITFGVQGTYQYAYNDGTPKVDFPSGLLLEVTTSLTTIKGQWIDSDWKPKAEDASSIIEIGTGIGSAGGICIDLTKGKLELRVAAGFDIPDVSFGGLDKTVVAHLKLHFAKFDYRLCLAAIGNLYDVNSRESQVLQPKNFCFSIVDKVLMLWIGLKGGSGNGTEPSQRTPLTFAPGSESISPVPQEKTASIIFSHFTMANVFLGPALRRNPDADPNSAVVCSSKMGDDGMKFDFKFSPNLVYNIERESKNDFWVTRNVDGCHVSMNEQKCALNVIGDDRPTQAKKAFSLSWTSDTKTINCDEWYHSQDMKTSSCDVSFSLQGSGQWVPSNDNEHPNRLGITTNFDEYFKVKVTPKEPSFWERFGGQVGGIPEKYRNVQAKAPIANLRLDYLDYFLTTNLLLPGQRVFVADAPAPATASVQAGIATPRDTILTGNVVQNPSLHLRRVAHTRECLQSLDEAVMLPLPSPLSKKPTLDDLKEALFSYPGSTFHSDFVKKCIGDRPSMSVADLLGKHGFGHLANENFMSLYGTTLEDLAGEPSKSLGPEPPSSIDLRLYAGDYIISQPSELEGEQFFVDPTKGAIRMRNVDIIPQQVYDVENKRVVMVWKSPTGAACKAHFSIFMDQESRITGTKCSGTMAPGGDGSPPVPFEAALKITTPPPARMVDMTDMTRTGLTAAGAIIEAVSAVIAFCAIISKIAHDCYTQQQSAGMRAAQAANDNRLNESNRQLQNNVAAEIAEVIPEQYGNRLPQLNEAVNQIKNGGSQAAEERFGDLADHQSASLLDRMERDPNIFGEVHLELQTSAHQFFLEHGNTALQPLNQASAGEAFERNELSAFVSEGTGDRIIDDTARERSNLTITNLTEGPNPYGVEVANAVIDREILSVQDSNLAGVQQELRDIEHGVENSQRIVQEQERRVRELSGNIETETDRAVYELARQELENRQSELRAEIESQSRAAEAERRQREAVEAAKQKSEKTEEKKKAEAERIIKKK
ncbi:hypothetical protein F5X68DRAFT_230281 [Plectosphaerella plurivora]|uniref:Uncharacterized protein n=1 Tax=Plectosphaerella plurivora TaxID=936078 RepID=A0A9P8VG26_9PEZI|nr:hypothetical protein F5X68DRAFT_230281 [Plectosphaerella plurivora]